MGEKFVCENCSHHEDADTQAGCVLAQRGKEKLGIDTLRVVSPKVTPVLRTGFPPQQSQNCGRKISHLSTLPNPLRVLP